MTLSAFSALKDDSKHLFLRRCFLRHYYKEVTESLTREFFDFLEAEEAYYYSGHYYRYLSTFSRITRFLPIGKDAMIIELGGASPISDFLNLQFDCFTTESDLRLEIDAADECADIVMSFEVLEHIKDIPEKTFDEITLFQESGARFLASEIMRILKPGGLHFMTTPNATAANNIHLLLEGVPPMTYRPHVREYSREEIMGLFCEFELVHHETQCNFFLIDDQGKEMTELILSLGGDGENRGDDHLFIFRKAAAATPQGCSTPST